MQHGGRELPQLPDDPPAELTPEADAGAPGPPSQSLVLAIGQLHLLLALFGELPALVVGWRLDAHVGASSEVPESVRDLPELVVSVPAPQWLGVVGWLEARGYMPYQVDGVGVHRLVDRMQPRRFTAREIAAMDDPDAASGGA